MVHFSAFRVVKNGLVGPSQALRDAAEHAKHNDDDSNNAWGRGPGGEAPPSHPGRGASSRVKRRNAKTGQQASTGGSHGARGARRS